MQLLAGTKRGEKRTNNLRAYFASWVALKFNFREKRGKGAGTAFFAPSKSANVEEVSKDRWPNNDNGERRGKIKK
eukprot:scaffold468_cov133-Skeletonema_menzelii.AAC.6